jgi:ribosomal protein L16 Arg81 hydroxylase
MQNLLGKLLHPISTKEFFENYFEKNYLFIQNDDTTFYDSLLTLEVIDQLLSTQVIPPQNIQMARKDGLSHHYWTKHRVNQGIFLDIDKLSNALYQGNSLVITDTQNYLFSLHQLVNVLSKELLAKTWANIYITPARFQAFKRHYDTHDVFILQIRGKKQWNLFEMPFALPHSSQPYHLQDFDYEKMKPHRTLTLTEGDFLYVPRGMVHEAIAQDDLSVHITIGFKPPLVHDLLDVISKEALKDDFFRKSISINNIQLTESSKLDFKKKLHQIIDNLSIDQLIEEKHQKYIKKYSVSKSANIISKLAQSQPLSLNTKISKYEGVNYKTYIKELVVVIEYSEQEEAFPFFLKPIIEAILNSGTKGILVKDIPQNFGDDKLIPLIQRFITLKIFKVINERK